MRPRPLFLLPVLLIVIGAGGLAVLNKLTEERRQEAADNRVRDYLMHVSGMPADAEWRALTLPPEQSKLAAKSAAKPVGESATRVSRIWLANDRTSHTDNNTGQSTACVLEVITARAYNDKVRLLVGLRANNNVWQISGVRVLRHAETPGLGDRITEPSWLQGFTGMNTDTPEKAWRTKRHNDSGDFAALTGATISANAVLMAVRDTLRHVATLRDTKGRALCPKPYREPIG